MRRPVRRPVAQDPSRLRGAVTPFTAPPKGAEPGQFGVAARPIPPAHWPPEADPAIHAAAKHPAPRPCSPGSPTASTLPLPGPGGADTASPAASGTASPSPAPSTATPLSSSGTNPPSRSPPAPSTTSSRASSASPPAGRPSSSPTVSPTHASPTASSSPRWPHHRERHVHGARGTRQRLGVLQAAPAAGMRRLTRSLAHSRSFSVFRFAAFSSRVAIRPWNRSRASSVTFASRCCITAHEYFTLWPADLEPEARFDQPQHRAAAHRNADHARQAGTGPAGEREPDRGQRRPQPLGPPRNSSAWYISASVSALGV